MGSINPITRKVIIVIIVASVVVHLLSLFLAQTLMTSWRWQQIPFHSSIEIAGSVIALFVSYILVLLESNKRGTSYNYIIASALAAMGILDGMHAIVPTGQLFVWLHSSATFFGGILFLTVFLPKTYRNKIGIRWLVFIILFSLTFAISSIIYAEHLPIMANKFGFTQTAIILNVVGGCMLLTTAIKLFATYLATRQTDDLLFVLHCSMFGFAAIMFQQSILWDISWWGWHFLRFFAYGVALWFALANELMINLQIKHARDTLNEQVELKSAQLTHTSLLLKTNQEQQNVIFSCLTDAIIVCDKKGNIQYFSPPAEKMFGYTREEMINSNLANLMHLPIENTTTTALIADIFEAKLLGMSQELMALNSDKTKFPIETIISEFKHSEEINVVAVIREISARKKYELELQQAKQQADLANEAKSAFLANTSHEIRTPMNGVYGNLQLLAKEKLPPTALNYVEKAIYSTKSLMTIIDDILDISKVEAGKLKIESIEFSLQALLDNIFADASLDAKNKAINFKALININHDTWVGDEIRLRQVLLNVISNAIKFTEIGAVTVTASNDEISKQLIFTVSDTGIGMNEEAVINLFNRFEQADTSITRKFGGTGIGMSITYALVKLMHGSIVVASKLNKGSSFTIKLPLQKGTMKPKDEPKVNLPQFYLANKTILVAEDNRINQAIVKAMLQDTGASVEIANNGIEATDMAKNLKPDIILMDIQMPELDGISACKAIKKFMPKCPIIALTANVMSCDIQLYDEVGFDGHIGKPIELDIMLNTLAKLLHQK